MLLHGLALLRRQGIIFIISNLVVAQRIISEEQAIQIMLLLVGLVVLEVLLHIETVVAAALDDVLVAVAACVKRHCLRHSRDA